MGYAKNRIYPFFCENYPDLKASQITPWIMQEFVNHLKDCGLKTSSIRKYLVPLRNATAYGTERQLLLVDPLVNYKYAPQKKKQGFFNTLDGILDSSVPQSSFSPKKLEKQGIYKVKPLFLVEISGIEPLTS